jgi:2-amino-4-hydroxy-6-hydroxymethyldihydropteridine diphosphokinase
MRGRSDRSDPCDGAATRETLTERVGYLGLGSNIGDREVHIRRAIAGLTDHGVDATSSLYETEPVGEILDQPDFLNAAVRVRTTLDPEALLDLCKAIEAEHGRVFGGPRHGPRPIDLDLLLLGEIEMSSDRLTLPHPEITSRRFVLTPLLELDPELELPDGTRLDGALTAIEGQQLRLVGPPPALPRDG